MVASKEEEGKRESSGSASDEQHPETCLVRAGIWSLIELYQMMENIFRDLPKPLKQGSFLPQRTVNHDLPPPILPVLVLLYPPRSAAAVSLWKLLCGHVGTQRKEIGFRCLVA